LTFSGSSLSASDLSFSARVGATSTQVTNGVQTAV
jgi:hypothetical protein